MKQLQANLVAVLRARYLPFLIPAVTTLLVLLMLFVWAWRRRRG